MNESSHSDGELLKLLAAGDEAAFRTLFERYRDNLFLYISRFVKSDQVAEELVMDVFMKLWLGRDIALRIEHFSAFLFRVARNKCIDFLRSAARDDDFRQLLWVRLQGAHGEQADSILLLQEYETAVRDAIELLSPQRRKVYQMSRERDYTHDQIARQLKISKATVNNQSAYPSMVWQTYDYYYDLTGAYWGARQACEPLHILWDPVDNAVKVINTTRRDETLTATAAVYNMDGTPVPAYSQSSIVEADAGTATRCFTLGFGEQQRNLSVGRPVVASSSANGVAAAVTDGNSDTRWSSKAADSEWIYIDLGRPSRINGVGLNWETAYGKAFRIQVSDDTRDWKDVYTTTHGHEGRQQIDFDDTIARYVRMLGTERGSGWGYSLWDFDVFGPGAAASGLAAAPGLATPGLAASGMAAAPALSDVHFIRLSIKDKNGMPLGSNFYWRGNRRKDFTALNNLPRAALKVTSSITRRDGKCFMTVKISNPLSSPGTAFAVRVQAVKPSGEQILPAYMDDDYFTLFRGESKVITIEFAEALAGGQRPQVRVEAYNK